MISSLNRSRSFLRTYGYWIFVVLGGVILVLLDDLDIEPFFSILAFFYWSLLFFWGARWIFRQIKSIIKQKKEKTSMELLHLQSQVNPHFFFNMLNNLYGLVEKDSTKAQALILKLSDLMRYSIYEGQRDLVSLDEEIAYLKNYIALHKMRYHKPIAVKFDLKVTEEKMMVMPLLFIILLENAFKHGVENLTEGSYVHLNLRAKDGEIHFEVENNFASPREEVAEGIGLKNLKRRLQLMYPKKHALSLISQAGIYKAQLTLEGL